MDLRVQVLAVFGVALIFTVLLAILLKKTRMVWILTAVMLLPAAAGTLAVVQMMTNADTTATATSGDITDASDPSDYVKMANALIGEGMTRSADELLDEYAAVFPVNDAYMHARARLEAVRGDYGTASGIYKHLIERRGYTKDSAEKEYQELQTVLSGSSTHESLVKTIRKSVSDMDVSSTIKEAAQTYAAVDAMSSAASSSDAASAVKKYERIMDYAPSLMYSSVMEQSYLKSLILAKQYDKIISRSHRYNTADEFLVLSALCRSGRLTEKVLKDAAAAGERSARVLEWVRAQNEYFDFAEKKDLVNDAIAALKDSRTGSVSNFIDWVRGRIWNLIESGREREISKLCLELARLDYAEGKEEEAAPLIRQAMLTAGDSADSAYAGPIRRLNRILENKEDTESLKLIDQYVQLMVSNMGSLSMKPGAGADRTTDEQFTIALTETIEDEYGIAGSEQEDFSEYVTAEVNQVTASINIASVDATQFDKVSAVIAIDSSIASTEEEFKQNIELLDCDVVIPDYTVQKLNDMGVNIILVCDNSGSMSGSKISDLKAAVQTFTDHLDPDVRVGIVSFDSSLLSNASAALGSDAATLNAAISNMGAYGGTSIYTGLSSALGQMNAGDTINVIIVMSDGQDSVPSAATMDDIRRICNDNDITVYAMGLGGDVDSGVLSSYAAAGGGSYTFVSDSNTLLSFYNYIYGISRNRFRVTYTAADTLKTDRKLRASYTADVKIFDERAYRLETENDLDDSDVGEDYTVSLQNVTLGGFDTRLLKKTGKDQQIRLRGDGLVKELNIGVSIQAGASYTLDCVYESDTSWVVTVPASVSCGEYDVLVTVNGKRAVFDSGLVITNDDMRVITFGQYVFEATGISELDNSLELSGYVRMNGWLGFVGTVTLTGDRENDDMLVMNADRAYVTFQPGEAQLNAFAKVMADFGHTLTLNELQNVKLFRNEGVSPSSDSFRVEPVTLSRGFVVQNLFEVNTPGLLLYPDRYEIDFNRFNTKFPFQDKLLKAGGMDKIFEYSVEHSEKLIVSQYAVDCDFEIKVGSTDDDLFHEAHFGNMRLFVNLNEFNLKINTKDGDFSFKIAVNVAMLSDGLGLELAWKDSKFDSAVLFCDYDINTTISGVPVTFSDFSLGVKGLKNGLSGLTLTGGCKVSCVKVSALFKDLENYVGDVSVMSLDDVSMELRFNRPYISLSAKLKFLEKVELGNASIKVGMDLPYTNQLLGYNGDLVNGFVGSLGLGIKMETSNCKLDVGGSTELALTDKVLGLSEEGHGDIDVHWWKIGTHLEADCKVFLGFYQKHNGSYCFALIAQINNGKQFKAEWDKKGAIV